MDTETGCSLAAHINDNSTRFSANVLDFAGQAWVIIRDSEAGHTHSYVEPIVDVPDYLVRAGRRSPRTEDEYRDLLVSWLALQPGKPAENAVPDADGIPV